MVFLWSRRPRVDRLECALLDRPECRLTFTESAWYRRLILAHRGPENRSPVVVWPYPIFPLPPGPIDPPEYDALVYLKNDRFPGVAETLMRRFDRVAFVRYGRYRREELWETARRSRCCCYLADDDRGPLALAEILLCGCPTVGVPTGAPFVEPGRNGVLLEDRGAEAWVHAAAECFGFDRREVAAMAGVRFDAGRIVEVVVGALDTARRVWGLSRKRLLGLDDFLVHRLDDRADQVGLVGLQEQGEFLVQAAVAVHFGGRRGGPFGGQRAAGADAAVQLVEIGLGPAGEQLGTLLDHLGHDGIGLAVEVAVEELGGVEEQFVAGDAQALGQAVEGPSVGAEDPLEDAADGAAIQSGPLGHLVERPSQLRQQPPQVLPDVLRHGDPFRVGGLEGEARKKSGRALDGTIYTRILSGGARQGPHSESLTRRVKTPCRTREITATHRRPPRATPTARAPRQAGKTGPQQYRVWIAAVSDWQPREWWDVPPAAVAIEPAERGGLVRPAGNGLRPGIQPRPVRQASRRLGHRRPGDDPL